MLDVLGRASVRQMGVDITFLVVTSISLQAAMVISVQMFLVHMGGVICAAFFGRALPERFRVLLYIAVSTSIMLVGSMLLGGIFPLTADILGMYIYLTAVNSMTLSLILRADEQPPYKIILDGLSGISVFILLMFLVSAIREYLGSGMLFGVSIPALITLDGASIPFFGFIVVGFVLAGGRFLQKQMTIIAAREISYLEKD